MNEEKSLPEYDIYVVVENGLVVDVCVKDPKMSVLVIDTDIDLPVGSAEEDKEQFVIDSAAIDESLGKMERFVDSEKLFRIW